MRIANQRDSEAQPEAVVLKDLTKVSWSTLLVKDPLLPFLCLNIGKYEANVPKSLHVLYQPTPFHALEVK